MYLIRLMLVGVWLGLLRVLFYFFDHYIQSSGGLVSTLLGIIFFLRSFIQLNESSCVGVLSHYVQVSSVQLYGANIKIIINLVSLDAGSCAGAKRVLG